MSTCHSLFLEIFNVDIGPLKNKGEQNIRIIIGIITLEGGIRRRRGCIYFKAGFSENS